MAPYSAALTPTTPILSTPCLPSRALPRARRESACRASADDGRSWTRREITKTAIGAVFLAPLLDGSTPAARAGLPAEVGSYLPVASDPRFALFVPDSRKTPALRAGTVDPQNPYRFELPVSFREGKVANILSGNYCQPRCDEPWTEVIFEDPEMGRIALLASPLKKLTNKVKASIEDIGPPEGVVQSIGSYITGTFLDEESVLSMEQKKQEDGRSYYYYEVDSPYGTLGRHSFSACVTKDEVALLLVASANEKQWNNSKSQLRHVMESFRA